MRNRLCWLWCSRCWLRSMNNSSRQDAGCVNMTCRDLFCTHISGGKALFISILKARFMSRLPSIKPYGTNQPELHASNLLSTHSNFRKRLLANSATILCSKYPEPWVHKARRLVQQILLKLKFSPSARLALQCGSSSAHIEYGPRQSQDVY
jgi:hypothetical protein